MATVLVDAENVRRSVWPNIAPAELERLVGAWGRANAHDARVVWEGDESADDRIANAVLTLEGDVWVVTSDRELRGRVADATVRIIGGGAFAHELMRLA
jgi:hypothetical protein